jgi:acyl-CoA thioesterase-2
LGKPYAYTTPGGLTPSFAPHKTLIMDISEFLALLDIEPTGPDRWLARSPDNGWKRVFGGQVLAQALVAAQRSVEDRTPHSLHGYFILGGDPALPIELEVERVRDGRSFAVRRVVARQRGETMFFMSVSFQTPEEGALNHFLPPPAVTPPEETPDPVALAALMPEPQQMRARGFFSHISPIEIRPLDLRRYSPSQPGALGDPHQNLWIRLKGPLPDDPAIHRAALVYLSDMTLIDTVLVAHGYSIARGGWQTASLDHAVWLHRSFRADEWLLYAQDSPTAQGARGLTRGLLYTRDGVLAATTSQEGLVRRRPEREAPKG